MRFEFENFLKDRKEVFCNYRCRHGDGRVVNIVAEDYDDECNRCGAAINKTKPKVSINPCDYCEISEFIREIRDCDVVVG